MLPEAVWSTLAHLSPATHAQQTTQRRGREKMGKEPTCTESKCSKSLGALLDDLDRLVVVAGAHLAHRSDFARAKWRPLFVGSASYYYWRVMEGLRPQRGGLSQPNPLNYHPQRV